MPDILKQTISISSYRRSDSEDLDPECERTSSLNGRNKQVATQNLRDLCACARLPCEHSLERSNEVVSHGG